MPLVRSCDVVWLRLAERVKSQEMVSELYILSRLTHEVVGERPRKVPYCTHSIPNYTPISNFEAENSRTKKLIA